MITTTDVSDLRLNTMTEVLVEWEDEVGPKTFRFYLNQWQQLAAAILAMPNRWGTISLINARRSEDGSPLAEFDRLVWCDGTDRAERIHQSKMSAAAEPAGLPFEDPRPSPMCMTW